MMFAGFCMVSYAHQQHAFCSWITNNLISTWFCLSCEHSCHHCHSIHYINIDVLDLICCGFFFRPTNFSYHASYFIVIYIRCLSDCVWNVDRPGLAVCDHVHEPPQVAQRRLVGRLLPSYALDRALPRPLHAIRKILDFISIYDLKLRCWESHWRSWILWCDLSFFGVTDTNKRDSVLPVEHPTEKNLMN